MSKQKVMSAVKEIREKMESLESLAKHFPDDEERPPIPKWIEKGITHDERLSSKRALVYPLLVLRNAIVPMASLGSNLSWIMILGGIMLIYMGYAMLKNIRNAELSGGMYQASPVVAGVLLAVGNPYFIIWWATVGATLILSAAEFGYVVFIAFIDRKSVV